MYVMFLTNLVFVSRRLSKSFQIAPRYLLGSTLWAKRTFLLGAFAISSGVPAGLWADLSWPAGVGSLLEWEFKVFLFVSFIFVGSIELCVLHTFDLRIYRKTRVLKSKGVDAAALMDLCPLLQQHQALCATLRIQTRNIDLWFLQFQPILRGVSNLLVGGSEVEQEVKSAFDFGWNARVHGHACHQQNGWMGRTCSTRGPFNAVKAR